MTGAPTPKATAAPRLVLCRQCIQYVYEGTEICPHCGGSAREPGERYREEGYQIAEAIQQIELALERHKASSD
ncbi:MAG: hypothetical protein WDO17_14260 [Alphaproteobacteria bacterium]